MQIIFNVKTAELLLHVASKDLGSFLDHLTEGTSEVFVLFYFYFLLKIDSAIVCCLTESSPTAAPMNCHPVTCVWAPVAPDSLWL